MDGKSRWMDECSAVCVTHIRVEMRCGIFVRKVDDLVRAVTTGASLVEKKRRAPGQRGKQREDWLDEDVIFAADSKSVSTHTQKYHQCHQLRGAWMDLVSGVRGVWASCVR